MLIVWRRCKGKDRDDDSLDRVGEVDARDIEGGGLSRRFLSILVAALDLEGGVLCDG